MVIGSEWIERGLARAVEVRAILLESVIGGEVHAARTRIRVRRRPGSRRRSARSCAPSERRDCADAAPAKRPSPRIRARRVPGVPRSPRGQFGAAHVRESDATSLEEGASSMMRVSPPRYSGVPVRLAGVPRRPKFLHRASLPGVAPEWPPVEPLQVPDYAILQPCQIIPDVIDVHGDTAGSVRNRRVESAAAQVLGIAGARWAPRASMPRTPMSWRHCIPSKRMPSTTW